ncbi:MAG: 16S rRNA (cytosine(1402)-N(4))-methyltransferase RsmH [Wenzhouxiangellaceae bacterium]|nr:16S rRNA (cytosine(1402)-N(4))-methyltransferase RsmH [Wenzhouxiangellaceae bacterium]
MSHVPVLGEAAVDALNVRQDGIYLDATFGRGGHSRLILERLGPAGRLIAVDADPEAIAFGEREFAGETRLVLVRRNFRELAAIVHEHAPGRGVDGILMDLGVSSPQLDTAGRGFSFRLEGPLDMRLDPDSGASAAAWLAEVDEAELAEVLREFGEERFAHRIARAIVRARVEAPIRTTGRLADIVEQAVPARAARGERIHPATRTFQAIRIAVNAELEALDAALAAAIDALAPGGRLVVISFHSLEDRRVKRAIRAAERPPAASRRRPAPPAFRPRLKSVDGLTRPDPGETGNNPRARSARMRVAERLAEPAPGDSA